MTTDVARGDTKPTLLVKPSRVHLASYVATLEAGWSPDNIRSEATARAHLKAIARDADAFLALMYDPEGRGPPVELPDGSKVKRLPGLVRWIFDGEFCGVIGLRWQAGTDALPDYVLGHIGFSVVSWKRNQGYARRALQAMLPIAADQGLGQVALTTNPDNLASQRVIEACGGVMTGRFEKLAGYGGGQGLRYVIALSPAHVPRDAVI